MSIICVLNLIINGIPSIQHTNLHLKIGNVVLNLIINGIPSILYYRKNGGYRQFKVLNLIINGIPSILEV